MTIDVVSYFRGKAERYDEVDQQVYWRLSDALLWELFTKDCLNLLPAGFAFLDAGGGTGRWTMRVLDAYPDSRGTLVDLSQDMLAVAARKRDGDRTERLDLVHGDLEDLPAGVAAQTYDVIWNFHNVIGFLRDPAATLTTLAGLLRPGGRLVTLAPNLYHSAYFNLASGRLGEAERAVAERSATFTDDMPALKLFTPESLADMYRRAGCPVELLTGFPTIIYPAFQETQIEGSSRHLRDILEDPESFRRTFDMEVRLIRSADVAARGNNILVVGRKGGHAEG